MMQHFQWMNPCRPLKKKQSKSVTPTVFALAVLAFFKGGIEELRFCLTQRSFLFGSCTRYDRNNHLTF